jgi:type II secretion system protein D
VNNTQHQRDIGKVAHAARVRFCGKTTHASRVRHLAALGVASLLVAWATFGPVLAEGPAKSADAKSYSVNKSAVQTQQQITSYPGGEINLNYLQASWKKVLEDFARQTGTTLEAERLPTTKYSRRDWRKHPSEEALNILNRELSPQGYKLTIRGEKLVLSESSKTRQEYVRQDAAAVRDVAEDRGAKVADRTRGVKQTQVQPIRTADGIDTGNRVQPASHRDTVDAAASAKQPRQLPRLDRDDSGTAVERRDVATERSRQTPRDEPSLDSAPNDHAAHHAERDGYVKVGRNEVVRVVPMEENRAVVVGRIIHDGFGSFSSLVDQGPEGLQGFRVQRMAGRTPATGAKRATANLAGDIQFAVGIDRDANELIVQAEPKLIKQIVRLIETVDAIPISSQHQVRAVATTKDATQVAKVLQSQLERLAQADRAANRGGRRAVASRNVEQDVDEEPKTPPARNGTRNPLQPANEAEPKPNADAEKPKASDLPSLIGGLKGDVAVEAMPDLGVLIIRGNQKDVDAVMSVVREIERLSAGTAPEVHLLMLQHVSSEGLATLLNSIYERMGNLRSRTVQQTQTVTVIPVLRPNAVLILAAASDMESVLNLADELDQPTDPETNFEVFPLKHAIASEVAETIEELYPVPAQQAGQAQRIDAGLAPRVRVTADGRTNSVIVQARPRDMEEVAVLIKRLDTDESGATNQIRIFQLKSATATELATTLQDSLQNISSSTGTGASGGRAAGGTGGTQGGTRGTRDVKSIVLQFLTVDGDRERIVRSGILDDVHVAADARTNSLVVTAPEQSMELMTELIRQLDRPAASVAEIKVFTLANGDATQAITLLERLFPPPNQQGQGQGQNQGNQSVGIQVAGADDAGSGLIPMRFSVDARTNSILAIGGAEALRVVEAILLRLDASDIRQRESTVIRLNNSPAADVANAINQFLQSQRQAVTQVDPNLFSPFEQIEREVVVVADPVSNSLLISATPRFFDEIKDIVTRLDMAPEQVIIQALIVEVALDNTDEFGVELGFQDPVLFSRSTFPAANITTIPVTSTLPNGTQTTDTKIISQSGSPGFLFGNPNDPLGNNIAGNPGKVGTQGINGFGLGRVNGDLGYGGLVLSASSDAVNILLRALAQRRRVDILSRPQIRTLNNQTAQIQVGQDVPVVNGLNTSVAGVVNPLVQRLPAGIILTVTPRITPDKMVVMEVIAEKSLFLAEGVPLFTDSTGRTIEAPKKDITTVRTTASVRNNQTAVLGGMITKNNVNEVRKAPILGDIPLLGHLFRYDYNQSRRTELLIFLTPRLIATDEDSEMIKQIEMERINFIECEAELIHGPLRGISSQVNWSATDGDQPVIPPFILTPPLPGQDGVQTPPPEEFSVPTSKMPASPSKPKTKPKTVGLTSLPKPKR